MKGVQLSNSNEIHDVAQGNKPLLIVSVLALAAAAIGALVYLEPILFPVEQDLGSQAVVAEIRTDSAGCTEPYPLEVTLANVSEKDVLTVGFIIYVSDAGHSTEYYSSVLGSDLIIPTEPSGANLP